MAKSDRVTPPVPAILRRPGEAGYEEPASLKPEDFRARLQLEAVKALEVLSYHAVNLDDPRSSIAAASEILDRAGYVPPAKGKGDAMFSGGAGEAALPSIEEDSRELSEAFSQMQKNR